MNDYKYLSGDAGDATSDEGLKKVLSMPDSFQTPPAQVFAVKATTPTPFYYRCSICRLKEEYPEGKSRKFVAAKATIHNLTFHNFEGGY